MSEREPHERDLHRASSEREAAPARREVPDVPEVPDLEVPPTARREVARDAARAGRTVAAAPLAEAVEPPLASAPWPAPRETEVAPVRPGDAPPLPPSMRPKRPSQGRSRALARAAVVGLAGLAVSVGAVALAWHPVLRYVVTSRARDRGVDLDFERARLGASGVTLERAEARLVGAPEVKLTARALTLRFDGFSVARLEGRGADVELVGPQHEVAQSVLGWSRANETRERLPVSLDDATLRWRPSPGASPEVLVTGASLERDASGLSVRADSVHALGLPLGPGALELSGEHAPMRVGLGASTLAAAPVRVTITTPAQPERVTVEVAKTSVRDLALSALGPLALVAGPELPRQLALEGRLDLVRAAGRWEGALDATLHGFVPPHPRELDGVLGAGPLRASAKVSLRDAGPPVLEVRELATTSGALTLRGQGEVALLGAHARVRGKLTGSVRCSSLARSAAAAHVGGDLGDVAGVALGLAVRGEVKVGAELDLDTSRPEQARVVPSVSVGCTF